MKQELFYVAASREREDIAIITSDVNRLGESIGVSMARPSAVELVSQIARAVESPKLSADHVPTQIMQPRVPVHEIVQGQGFGLGM